MWSLALKPDPEMPLTISCYPVFVHPREFATREQAQRYLDEQPAGCCRRLDTFLEPARLRA